MNEQLHQTPQRKPLYLLLLSAGMILPASALFTASSDLPHIFILTLIGMFLSFVIRTPFHYNDRTVIYSLLTALLLAFGFDYLISMDKDRFGIGGDLFVAHLSGPVMIYLAVLATFFESGPYSVGVTACFALSVTMLGGDVYSSRLVNPRLPFLNPLMAHIYGFFSCVALWEVLALVFAFMELRKSNLKRKIHLKTTCLWQGRGIRMLALLLIPLLGLALLALFNRLEGTLRKFEAQIINASFKRTRTNMNIVFNKEVDLNRTISEDVQNSAERVLLRAKSSVPPGYLRGRVYTSYANGRWFCLEKDTDRLKFRSQGGILSYKTFFYEEENTGKFRMHILPAAGFTTDVLLLPGSCDSFEIVADRVSFSRHGVLTPEEWEKDGGYTALFPSVKELSGAFPRPLQNPPDNKLLAVPSYLGPELDKAIAEAVGPGKQKDSLTAPEKAQVLLKYFSDKFKYSLDASPSDNNDPVVQFLLKTKEGHCELFASSMTLMLRRLGIPARYVTGFICEEQHPSGQYYVARVGNAHAWLEAYLPEKGWTLLEPTPPSGIPNFQHKWSAWESWFDRLKEILSETLSDLRRGHFAEAVIALVSNLLGFLKDLLWNPWRALLFTILVSLFVFLRLRRRNRAQKAEQVSPACLALSKELRRMENFVYRESGISREQSATLKEWSEQIANSPYAVPGLSEWLDAYEALRYRTPGPSIDEVKRLILLAHELKRSKKRLG